MEYGPQYDAALHVLLWELLSKLEKLLPVPDLKQVFSPSIQVSPVALLLQIPCNLPQTYTQLSCDYRLQPGSALLLLCWRNVSSRHLKS